VDIVLDLHRAVMAISLQIARGILHISLLPCHDIKDLIGLFYIDCLETTVNIGELLHNLKVLASRFFVKPDITLRLHLEVLIECHELLVQLLVEAVKTVLNSFLDHGKVSFPSGVGIRVTL